ncbi:Succinate dehydrogenase subunit 5 [Hirschfeldia incana]|nr:Succinate dehydrogenase subunit 5 [Hirschfeldia incana]
MLLVRSLCRTTAVAASVATLRSLRSPAQNQLLRNRSLLTRGFFAVSSFPSNRTPYDCRYPRATGIGKVRNFSEDVSHMPEIKDSDVLNAFKGLMAADWSALPSAVVNEAKKAVSKNTEDKAGQEALTNVFRAAEAVEEFAGILNSLKMEIDDSIGMSGENVKSLPEDITKALRLAYQRYTTYLDAFGPEEVYLKKKVETELGTKMIHLKMRCSGLGSEWGKVTVLGTSGLSGSYVEQRA